MQVANDKELEKAFSKSNPEHYDWRTKPGYVREHEQRLVSQAFLPLRDRILDLGCGDGATLMLLNRHRGAAGVDLFEEKLSFARSRSPQVQWVRADATKLPFPEQSFDQVIIRDLLHHVQDADLVVAEAARVLSPQGRVDVLEPNRYNPLIFAHALSERAERGELRSCAPYLERLLHTRFARTKVAMLQALPLHRALFHPRFGRPEWGYSSTLARRIVARVEREAERIVPKAMRAYIHVRAWNGEGSTI